ncbi:ankyrin repeat domain-containing protein 12 isoform X2 [Zerene cesonia]|uniref:ankyrin repeat domain-containing protein 12 isoform X2 n=1 Tax=Zerene cesonia TaxID=33412 RepID=UPI0018E51BBE|nr:ankyrin repeat domain-containing protein 12 isoform X2 [Zerene cesonia]
MPSTSRSRGSGRGPDGAPRTQVIAPMSERQQLALVMQISSQDAPPAAPTPAEERKRSRQQRNERGETPLHVAAIRGDHEQVKKLLDQGQEPDVTDFAGWTPLHEACSYGWLQVVMVLVNGGANVNAKGLDDDTPLHDAATSGNLKMVKFLIEHGAEPFVKNTKGKAPLDYAAPHIYEYLQSLKDNNTRATHIGRTRDDSTKKSGNASTNSEGSKRTNMESLAQGEFEGKEATPQEKGSNTENKEECTQLSSGVVSSTQDDTNVTTKKSYDEEESSEDDVSKRKKRKENDDKEPMAKPPPVARSGPGRKPPGPASKTGASPLNKGGASPNVNKGAATSSTGKLQATGKGTPGTKNKSGSGKGGVGSQAIKQERRSPVASPKPAQVKEEEPEDQKPPETTAPKVPPLKIVIPGGAGGSGSRNEQEEGGTGQRGGGKGRGNASTLPYVIPCTSADAGQTSDSSDGNCDDKRLGEGGKGGQRVLRSHRTIDGEKDKERTSPQTGSENRSGSGSNQALSSNKSPPPSSVSSNSMFRARRNKNAKRRRSRLHDDGHSKSNAKSFQGQDDHAPSTSSGGTGGRNEADGPGCRGRRYHSPLKSPKSTRQSYGLGGRGRRTPPLKSTKKRGHSSAPGPSVELHPRKRKIKASRESHSREPSKSEHSENSIVTHNVTHSNPYQMYIHKRKQIERRQKALFPVKPKPPKDFNKYLMNRCTYTLQNNVNPEPQVDIPVNLPQQMVKEFMSQERERTRLRIQHQVEKEKLVLAVEQEILRVHGRAERAVANQALPFSVCTILRDKEVYNVLAPDQEEKRNAQRSRCNGRQINSWLQEVDDKWEKIKEGMLRRQHTEAETLHAVQMMGWEWKLKELGLCDHKNTPKIDPAHVPQIHVSNFDLPA